MFLAGRLEEPAVFDRNHRILDGVEEENRRCFAAVTCFSLGIETRPVFGSGLLPIRLLREPPWVFSVMVMTG